MERLHLILIFVHLKMKRLLPLEILEIPTSVLLPSILKAKFGTCIFQLFLLGFLNFSIVLGSAKWHKVSGQQALRG